MSNFKRKHKNGWKKILTVFLSIVLGVGAIFGVTKILEIVDEPTKAVILSYEVGTLNDKGEYQESSQHIYTKEAFECQGLVITPEFDSTVEYRLFFYDSEAKFINSTNFGDLKFDGSVPQNAKYARIVIRPKQDQKVSWYEVYKYSLQLKVEVYKEQIYETSNVYCEV